ncbi:hypothetical protein [Streptomyces odontomachi]|uniref:hypothetical protein n=1 Tax=Streptomyces odontomachi TaxID=2944940 RepID=UPI00210B7C9C|nr:hypothetical protein [Streptomyces sp. ODS25]
MKTTTVIRTIANPQRTTLAHLADAEGLRISPEPAPRPEDVVILPAQTANPRRTVLLTVPEAHTTQITFGIEGTEGTELTAVEGAPVA